MGRKESGLYPVSLLDVSTGDCPIMIPHSGPRADRGPSLAPWLRPWPRGPTRLWGWLRAVLWATVALVVDPRLLVPADPPGSRLPADAPGSRIPAARSPSPAPGPGRSSRLPVPWPIMSILPVASDCPVALSTSIAACIGISGCNTLAKTAGCRGFSGRNGWPLGLTLNRGRNFSQA